MKALLTGIAVAILVAIGIGYFLPLDPNNAWEVYSTTTTRVGEPGSNLVGPGWTGLNQVEIPAEGGSGAQG